MMWRTPVIGRTWLRGRRYDIRMLNCCQALDIVKTAAIEDVTERAIEQNARIVASCIWKGRRPLFAGPEAVKRVLSLDELAEVALRCRREIEGQKDDETRDDEQKDDGQVNPKFDEEVYRRMKEAGR